MSLAESFFIVKQTTEYSYLLTVNIPTNLANIYGHTSNTVCKSIKIDRCKLRSRFSFQPLHLFLSKEEGGLFSLLALCKE